MNDAPLLDTPYLCFTLDHNEDAASSRFEQRYGAPPERIIEYDGKLWLGPVPETERTP